MKEDNESMYVAIIIAIVCSFVLLVIHMAHKTNAKIDCIKSTSLQCYKVDEIYKLCGVEK
jgi:hypothetical protein